MKQTRRKNEKTVVPWEKSATKLSLNEELSIEHLRRGVERSSWDRHVNLIRSSNGVACKNMRKVAT